MPRLDIPDDHPPLGQYRHPGTVRQPRLGAHVYDEVHLTPGTDLRMTIPRPVKRRLGLTATLIRKGGRGRPRTKAL